MMKKCLRHLAPVLLLCLCLQLNAKDVLYFVDVTNFYDQDGKPYVEIYLDVNAYSVNYLQGEAGQFQAAVDVELQIENKTASDGARAYERKFALLSPLMSDTSRAGTNFGIMDVRRVTLAPGEYIFTGFLKDPNNPEGQQHKFVRELVVEAQPEQLMSVSSIEFIQDVRKSTVQQPHSKHGYDIMPLVTNGTYVDMDSIQFYLELYHTERETKGVYFVNSYITLANSTAKMKQYQKTTRRNAKALDLVMGGFDIRELPSQTYYLNVDVYNVEQKLIANTSRKFFVANSRTGTIAASDPGAFDQFFDLTEEELDEYIHTLYYVSTATERNFAKSLKTKDEKKNYFYSFWEKRKNNPTDSPTKPWLAYKSRVDYANKQFKAAHLKGWRTDRGRVLLTYGAPNDIERFPSSNTHYPYHIWTYNKLKTQPNVKFVFFLPNMATDDWVMIHSDKLGEINNPRWEFDVVRTVQDGNLDVNSINERW